MATANKITLVSDRVERAKSFLLSQFKDKPNINLLVECLVEELQKYENGLIDLQSARTLDGAFGIWLDEIGTRLKVSRGNYNDDDYKTAIKIAMAKRTSSASIDDILRLVTILTSDTEATLTVNYPYLMELTGYMFCLYESPEGLSALADMFPLNSRIRIMRHEEKPMIFNMADRGFGTNATISDLIFVRQGIADDPRFTTQVQQIIPPAITTPVFNITPATISGVNAVGNVLTLTIGVWDGDDPITYTYQWMKDNNDISGATGLTYTLISGDEGSIINARVTATNAYGSAISISNAITTEAVIPPAPTFTNDGGLMDWYALRASDSGIVTAEVALNFKSTGEIEYLRNGTVAQTRPFLSTLVTASDYTVSYVVQSGPVLAGLNPNATHVLSSDRLISQSISSSRYEVKTGTYTFTIRKISDPSIFVSKTINITTEVEI